MRRLGTTAVIVLALLGMGAKCDTATTDSKGVKHITVKIGDGTKLGKNNYGLWKANEPAKNCRWVILKGGKVIGSGGPDDTVFSGTSTKGAVLSARNCGLFYK